MIINRTRLLKRLLKLNLLLIGGVAIFPAISHSNVNNNNPTTEKKLEQKVTVPEVPSGSTTSTKKISEAPKGIKKYLGLTYFSFFDGPGVGAEFTESPTEQGIAGDIGWTLWTNLSIRAKVSDNLAIDYQARLEQVLSNEFQFRDQGGRLGISGKLLKGEDWVLSGALNSDVPGLGAIPTQRTLVFNPGLFSTFSYSPKSSRFSLFALVAPRLFVYRDKNAMADQDLGLPPGTKPEISLAFNPSINYRLNDASGLRLGVTVDFRKNANQDSIQRWFAPIDMGYTHEFSKAFNIYPHLRVSGPWDNGIRDQIAARRGREALPWTDTLSFGLWINGTVF
jgi:hypothetical protein